MKKRLSYTSIILLFVYISCQPNVKVERDDNVDQHEEDLIENRVGRFDRNFHTKLQII